MSAPEKDDIDSENNELNKSTDEDSKCKKNIFNNKKKEFNLMDNNNNFENPFSLANNNELYLNNNDEIMLDKVKKNPLVKKKTRIVLEEINKKSKDSKNYALEFENLYDNFEREVDFVENIDNNSNVNSGSFKEGNEFFRKRSSQIIPFGSASKSNKKEENIHVDEYFNDFNNNDDFCNDLPKRKSSILGILETNVIKKKNSFMMEQ